LLHLWSLSVEEQFYLAWPVLLLVLLRARVSVRWSLAVIALGSFAFAEWLMQWNASAAFYQMPARAWELAAGALLATMPARAFPRLAGWLGLALVAFACAVPMPRFPGAGALPAVVGAVLVVACAHGGGTNALLSSRAFVGLGLVSYSLYLWHWPLLAIDRLLRIGPAPLGARVVLVALALLLAIASYFWVEKPLRRARASSRRTVAIGTATMALLACAALAWRGASPPLPPAVVASCHPFVAGQPVRIQRAACLGRGPKVVIWGDSYARAWSPLAEVVAERLQMPAAVLARDACPPLSGVHLRSRTPVEDETCASRNRSAVAYISTYGADTVIMAARWPSFMPYGKDALAQSVAEIAPHVRRIIIIGPTPELPDGAAKCAALGAACTVPRAAYEADSREAWAAIRALREPKLEVADAAGWMCRGDVCDGFRDGKALYIDAFHVSEYTARQYGAQVAASL
jgi:hypothetical protein